MHRLRGVFLAAIGAEEAQIEASFCAAIRVAKEQKSISLENAQKQPRRIWEAKSERFRRAWIPATSSVTFCGPLPFVQRTNEPKSAGRAQSREAAFGSRYGGTKQASLVHFTTFRKCEGKSAQAPLLHPVKQRPLCASPWQHRAGHQGRKELSSSGR
jgi:hypothetical protein